MTGSDLSNYAAKDITKTIIAVLIFTLLPLFVCIGWTSHSYYVKHYVETDEVAYKNGYTKGTHWGILKVVNYDRQNAGEKPYASYDEFADDLEKKAEISERISNFIDDLIREHKAEEFKKVDASKKYPKLWVGKK
jgi:hypothetical protein